MTTSTEKWALAYYAPFLDIRKTNCRARPGRVTLHADGEILEALAALVDYIRKINAEGRKVATEINAQPEEFVDRKIRSAILSSDERKLISEYLRLFVAQTVESRLHFIPLTVFEQREYVRLEELQDRYDVEKTDKARKKAIRRFKREMR